MRIGGIIVVAGLAAGIQGVPAGARATAQEPTFTVASIKPNLKGTQQGGGVAAPQPGGRFIALRATLRKLVEDAYDVETTGGPKWIDFDRFDINARADGERTPAEIMRMLRALLADRFKLAHHMETREVPVYTLLLRSDQRLGPGLRESDAKCTEEARRYFPSAARGFPPPCGDFRMGAREFTARGMTMAGLARVLAGRTGRPVLDMTGLTAAFDLRFEWSDDGGLTGFLPDSAGAGEPGADGVTLFTALQEQLGLRLQAARGQVEVLVIDRAEPPTPD